MVDNFHKWKSVVFVHIMFTIFTQYTTYSHLQYPDYPYSKQYITQNNHVLKNIIIRKFSIF